MQVVVTRQPRIVGRRSSERGYAMAALLVSIGVMGVLMSVAMPAWRHQTQRQKEEELIFRGEQYARAIGLFQRKYAGAFPPNLDILLDQKFLRRKYKDPMTEDGEFQLLAQTPQTGQAGQVTQPGAVPTPTGSARMSSFSTQTSTFTQTLGPQGGIIGVASKSKATSIKLYNGRSKYNEWSFVYTPVTRTPGGAPGQPTPGMPGMQRTPAGQGGPGMGRPPGGMGPGGSQRSFPPPGMGQPPGPGAPQGPGAPPPRPPGGVRPPL
jgi:type II secretory pathway pseudopilin PulG